MSVPGNDEHLGRVSVRIANAIVAFCVEQLGRQFHADDLRQYVRAAVGEIAPGSADRVLRDLRQHGALNYEVVSRSKSLYRVLDVAQEGA